MIHSSPIDRSSEFHRTDYGATVLVRVAVPPLLELPEADFAVAGAVLAADLAVAATDTPVDSPTDALLGAPAESAVVWASALPAVLPAHHIPAVQSLIEMFQPRSYTGPRYTHVQLYVNHRTAAVDSQTAVAVVAESGGLQWASQQGQSYGGIGSD